MPHGKSPKHTRKAKPARSRSAAGEGRSRPKAAAAKKAAAGGSSESESRNPERKRRERPVAFDASVRLQKLLAGAGFGSRREVEKYLIDERVTVNGKIASLGDRANPSVDEIRFDGERVMRERPAYWVVNKPRGVVTTVRDEEGRRTVMDLLPDKVGRLFPVGRLDKETTGLLLLTNDGDAAYALLHPSLGNEREYRVNVKGQIDAKAIGRLERGVPLEEGRTSPAAVSDVSYDGENGSSNLTLTLGEGKKRQIRRSLLILGFPVRRLVRVRMGPLRLGRLPVGEARPLRSEEKRALLQHVAWLKGEADAPPAASTAKPRKTSASRARKSVSEEDGTGLPKKKALRKKTARRGVDRNKPERKKLGKKSGPARKKKASRGSRSTGSKTSGPGRKGAAKKKGAQRASSRNGPRR
ncbi:MAG: pseudouridine synthase [Myxococcota bacterium]